VASLSAGAACCSPDNLYEINALRYYTNTPSEPLARTIERDRRLGSWLKMKVEDGIAKRYWLDEEWREDIRIYESIPSLRSTDVPDDRGRALIEVPIGASMTDSIASAVYDLIFNTSPILSCQGSPGYESHAYAFQLLASKLVEDEFVNFMAASNEFIIDTVMLGTGANYVINSTERIKKAAFTELKSGPRVYSIPIEDIVVPGGTFPDSNDMQFVAHRNYFFESELVSAAEQNGWDISNFMVAGNVDWVRQRRIEAARTDVDLQIIGGIYEVFYCHCQFDYNEDGYAEDLFVVWDRTSYEVGHVTYAPYDSRPFVFARYQLRPHIFYGLGVMTMAKPFEHEVTEWHNFKMQNAHLSNARVWAYKLGAVGIGEEFKISPNKAIGLGDPANDLKELKMSDMYPSAQQYEAATIALCEMRVGQPAANPSASKGVQAGKRVPAATAQTLMQQQNRRFAAPFDNIRRAIASTMTQCFMRMRETYEKGGDDLQKLMEYLVYTVGMKHATLIEQVFKEAKTVDMRDKVLIETTATAQSINRQADRQNAIERIGVMGQYYDKVMAIGQILFNPQAPPELKKLAVDVCNGSTESIRAFLRSFDDVRDPDVFIPQSLRDLSEASQGGGQPQAGDPNQPPQQGPDNGNNSGGQSGDAAPADGTSPGPQGELVAPLPGSSELGSGAKDTGILG